MKILGHLREVWRYPVKSMAGETLAESRVTDLGLAGDRAWALRDEAAGEIRGAKKFPALLGCTARFLAEPEPGQSPPAEIALPGGRLLRSDDASASAVLSELVGRAVTLWPLRPAEDRDHYRRGLPDNPDMMEELRTIFGREEGEPLPDLAQFPAEILEFTSPLGTYFDVFPLHLVTTASLEEMARRTPGSSFDARRFRANFVVETSDAAGKGLVEAGWTGAKLRIGDTTIRIVLPTVRCSMITQPQSQHGLSKDPGVLRAVVREGEQNLGAYAVVVEAGRVCVGDEVVLLDT